MHLDCNVYFASHTKHNLTYKNGGVYLVTIDREVSDVTAAYHTDIQTDKQTNKRIDTRDYLNSSVEVTRIIYRQ